MFTFFHCLFPSSWKQLPYFTHTHTHTHKHTQTQTQKHTNTHTHIHTQTHIYIYITSNSANLNNAATSCDLLSSVVETYLHSFLVPSPLTLLVLHIP
jgi:hypothetical protein